MFDGQAASGAAIALTEVLGWLRELAIIGAIIGASWKARGFFEDGKKFVERIVTHMDRMEEFATLVVENHLRHIEDDIKSLVEANGLKHPRRYEYDLEPTHTDRDKDKD